MSDFSPPIPPYVAKFFNSPYLDGTSEHHDRSRVGLPHNVDASIAFICLRSAIASCGISTVASQLSCCTRTVTLTEPPVLLNPQGDGTHSYGLMIPAIALIKANAHFTPAQSSVDDSLEPWEGYSGDITTGIIPYDQWKQQMAESRWVVDLIDLYGAGYNDLYPLERDEADGYGFGVIVPTSAEAAIIFQDLIWLYDIGLRDRDEYSFIVPLDSIGDGKSVLTLDVLKIAADSFSPDLLKYTKEPANSGSVVAILDTAIQETLIQLSNVLSLKSQPPAILNSYLDFPDNRTPLCRALMAEDAMILTRSGEYLHFIPEFAQLGDAMQLIALDILVLSVNKQLCERCRYQQRVDLAIHHVFFP